MVLATADQAGRPWASPVYYAPAAYREFFWVSRPEATHSQNIGARPEVGIVIFDSSVPISTGRGVYMSAVAYEVEDEDRLEGIDIFSQRSLSHGGHAWTLQDVSSPAAHLRLYKATAVEHSYLGADDRRVAVSP